MTGTLLILLQGDLLAVGNVLIVYTFIFLDSLLFLAWFDSNWTESDL